MKIESLFRYTLKWCVVLLVFSCLLMISGCESKEPVKTKHIGIVLFGDSRMPQVNGFKDGLNSLGYKENKSVRYTILNAKNKRADLSTIVQELIDQKVDLLVAAGGLEADTMKKMLSKEQIPVVVLYVNAIIERGLVESRRKPGWNVTGVDNLNAELSGKRIEVMRNLLPEMKKVLILYYEKIAPSRIGVARAKEMADKANITIDARAVKSRDDIQQVMQSLKPGDVDAMLTVPTAPIDNALKDLILPHVNKLKLPLMTHSKPLAEKGALASYGANFYDLGKQASRLADKIMKGSKADSIPFETPKLIVYTINKGVLDDVGIELSSAVKNQVNSYISTK